MIKPADTLSLHGKHSSLILRLSQGVPEIIYWGKKLSPHTQDKMLCLLFTQQQDIAGGPGRPIPLSLTPAIGQGYTAHPGITLSDATTHHLTDALPAWSFSPKITDVQSTPNNTRNNAPGNTPEHLPEHSQSSSTRYSIISQDSDRSLSLIHDITLCAATDVLTLKTTIQNHRKNPVTVHVCTAGTLAVPHNVTHIMGFEGRWANEFHTHTLRQFSGSYVRENRRGRTSHDAFPGLILHSTHANETQGDAYGFHLGWSGNHRVVAEKNSDGRTLVQMGELFLPEELSLATGERYTTPTLYASFSATGFTTLSQQFHRFVRHNILRPTLTAKPRPVHYNTWEAIYFDHDLKTLKTLATKAAALGVERFVLDDGWFKGRQSDKAGLGDWFVDSEKYPDGLSPLINHVNELGMRFGLWFEPEMVNADSDLYRQHPDWILGTPPNPQIQFRHQLVLDLTRPAVFDYLFNRLNTLLTTLNIEYIKWDMNRDLNHPGTLTNTPNTTSRGRPVPHQQTVALYALLSKLRAAHPTVEIESCSSGGGRADYGILAHTDRIWTSDNNDALARLNIQKGFSYFFPALIMGSHIGPRDCHITHRSLPMALRAPVALFGHMGMEMDLRALTADETRELKAMVTLYKTHRQLLHHGNLYRLDLNETQTSIDTHASMGFGIVCDQQNEAIFSYTQLNSTTAAHPTPYRFAGLVPTARYRLHVIWPLKSADDAPWPKASLFGLETNLPNIDDKVFTGEALMQLGFQLPVLTPQSNLLFYVKRCD